MPAINMSAVHLSFADLTFMQYLSSIKLLLLFVVGIVIYSLFVFKFYRFLASRDILKLDLGKHSKGLSGVVERVAKTFFYLLENMLLTPLVLFFWVAVLSLLLLLLTKNQTPESLLLTSAALVAAVRVTAYYNENLSQDLAKMVPFALLGIFISDISFFSFSAPLEVIKQIPSMWQSFLYYFIFAVILELIMRVLHTVVGVMILSNVPKKQSEEKK